MGKRNKFVVQAGIFLLCVIWTQSIVFAANSSTIVEKYTGESEIILYVRGAEKDFEDIIVQVGTNVCDSVDKSTLIEAKQEMRTLVMLDNSQSIPKKDRKLISKILYNLISDRAENEQIAVAVLNEQIEYLTDYTLADSELKAAVDKIIYRNTKTYLTDILYDWLSEEYISRQEDIYYRIVVIADGTDNKPIGYTQNEFYTLLREYPIPIYTIGVKTKDNNEDLENMFAISRAGNAESFLLDDMENVLDINAQLNADQNLLRVVIKPQKELLDGKKKALRIACASGEILSTEVIMPQMADHTERFPQDETVQTDMHNEEDKMSGIENGNINLYVILVVFVVVIVAVVLLAVLLIKKKRRTADSMTEPDNDQNLMPEEQPDRKADQTEIVDSSELQNEDQTVVFWDSQTAYHVILSDIKRTAKSFEFPLKSSVVLGRKQDICDIVLDYDRTVSGRHCRLMVRDGRFYITDLKSSNGTYINDRKVLTEMEIIPGNILKLGRLEVKFEVNT